MVGGNTVDTLPADPVVNKISYAKCSVKPVAVLAGNAAATGCVSYDFDHFFAGLFSQDSEYIIIKN
jgi:hypothetical protein